MPRVDAQQDISLYWFLPGDQNNYDPVNLSGRVMGQAPFNIPLLNAAGNPPYQIGVPGGTPTGGSLVKFVHVALMAKP